MFAHTSAAIAAAEHHDRAAGLGAEEAADRRRQVARPRGAAAEGDDVRVGAHLQPIMRSKLGYGQGMTKNPDSQPRPRHRRD